MRTLFLSSLIFVAFSFIGLGQNWFPLEVGNKSMSRYSYNYMGSQCDYYFIEVTADSIIDANKYYFVKNYSDRDGLYESFWLRYDHDNQTIFQHGNDTTVVFMDFNLPNGSSFVYFNPITGVSTNRTVFESTATHFGMTRNTKGFVDDGFWARMKEWIDAVGVKPFEPLIQVLQLNNQDTTYFEYNYGPDFSYFQPSLKTNEFNFVDTLFVWHHYTNNSGPGYKDFIDYLCLDTYYKSSSDSISDNKPVHL